MFSRHSSNAPRPKLLGLLQRPAAPTRSPHHEPPFSTSQIRRRLQNGKAPTPLIFQASPCQKSHTRCSPDEQTGHTVMSAAEGASGHAVQERSFFPTWTPARGRTLSFVTLCSTYPWGRERPVKQTLLGSRIMGPQHDYHLRPHLYEDTTAPGLPHRLDAVKNLGTGQPGPSRLDY